MLRAVGKPKHRYPAMSKGFTLIELLVVIAIIAILAAILFPVFARVREKARQTTCLSNLKQLGLAAYMYSQDYDEWLPYDDLDYDQSGDDSFGDGTWRGMLVPYCRNAQIFFCPGSQIASRAFDGSWNDYGMNASYAINYAHWQPGSHTPPFGQPLAMIEAASSCILLMESSGIHEVANPDGEDAVAWVPDTAWALRHNGGANYYFVDGHAKWLKPQALDPAGRDWLTTIEIE